MAQLAKQIFHAVGGLEWVRRRNRDGYRILMYHRFWPPTPETVAALREQLEHVRTNYVLRPLHDILRDVRDGSPLAPNTMAITIDDGHGDFYTTAYPALKEFALPATVFVTTGYIDGRLWLWFDRVVATIRSARAPYLDADVPGLAPHRLPLGTDAERRAAAVVIAEALQPLAQPIRETWTATLAERVDAQVPSLPAEFPNREFAPLTWDEIREMQQHGIHFGAHTVTHPTLSRVSDDATLSYELTESKRRVESETQREAPVFCYPNGRFEDVGDRIVAATKAAGFRAAVLAEQGLNTPSTDPFLLRRMAVDPAQETLYFQRQCAVLRR